MDATDKITGLVGLNLVLLLREAGCMRQLLASAACPSSITTAILAHTAGGVDWYLNGLLANSVL